jgi:hypothetical protein
MWTCQLAGRWQCLRNPMTGERLYSQALTADLHTITYHMSQVNNDATQHPAGPESCAGQATADCAHVTIQPASWNCRDLQCLLH